MRDAIESSPQIGVGDTSTGILKARLGLANALPLFLIVGCLASAYSYQLNLAANVRELKRPQVVATPRSDQPVEAAAPVATAN